MSARLGSSCTKSAASLQQALRLDASTREIALLPQTDGVGEAISHIGHYPVW